MATLIYAGIGTRATPPNVLADMAVMAGWLARMGWQLSSGGADGADGAFAAGAPAGQRKIWLPWRGYNGHRCSCLRCWSLQFETVARESGVWTGQPKLEKGVCLGASKDGRSLHRWSERSMWRANLDLVKLGAGFRREEESSNERAL